MGFRVLWGLGFWDLEGFRVFGALRVLGFWGFGV